MAGTGGNALGDVFASEGAFRAWYAATLPRVYGYLLARTGGDVATAEDLTQTTYLEAVRTWRRFGGQSSATTWLLSIARHRLVDHVRRSDAKSGVREIATVELLAVADVARASDRRVDVTDVLRRLPPMQRTVLVLHYMDDLPVREVARLLGKSEKAIESLLSRARSGYRALAGETTDG